MKLTAETTIDAPIGIVWRTFNDPADILKWDQSDDWQTTEVWNDLRVGGNLKLRLEPKEAGASFDFVATYTVIEPMRLIEWRTDDDRVVRVAFGETDAGVVVHQTFDAEPNTALDEQRQDWQGVLDNFARYVTASLSDDKPTSTGV